MDGNLTERDKVHKHGQGYGHSLAGKKKTSIIQRMVSALEILQKEQELHARSDTWEISITQRNRIHRTMSRIWRHITERIRVTVIKDLSGSSTERTTFTNHTGRVHVYLAVTATCIFSKMTWIFYVLLR